MADINGEGADATVEAVPTNGGQAIAVVVDVGSEGSIIEMVDRTVAEFGRLDVLHNNAAALGAELLRRDTGIAEMDLDVWDRTMKINLAGPMLSSKHAIPHMINSGGRLDHQHLVRCRLCRRPQADCVRHVEKARSTR